MRKMRAIILVAIPFGLCVVLGSCGGSSETVAAENNYNLAKENNASYDERCAKANAVVDAYGKNDDQEGYAKWAATRNQDCFMVESLQRIEDAATRAGDALRGR